MPSDWKLFVGALESLAVAIAALPALLWRTFQGFFRMVQTRRGLEIIIDAASTLYDFKSMQRLAEGELV